MRDFNTVGPVRADLHYCIPPLDRIDLSEVLDAHYSDRDFEYVRDLGLVVADPTLRVARGRIEREYALGSRRVDLLIVWPTPGPFARRLRGRQDRLRRA